MNGRLRPFDIASWLARLAAEIGLISVALLPLAMIAVALIVDAAMAERLMRARTAPPASCRLTATEAHCTLTDAGGPRTVTFARVGAP